MKKIHYFILFIFLLLLNGCVAPTTLVQIINPEDTEIEVREQIDLDIKIYQKIDEDPRWSVSNSNAEVTNEGVVTGLKPGTVSIIVKYGSDSDEIVITIIDTLSIDDIEDPYENVSKEEFYLNYKPAENFVDAYYRSQHGLMSGNINIPDQKPVIDSNQPKYFEKLIKNTSMVFYNEGNTYSVVDSKGNEVMNIYKDGAYVDLEEVAAYIFAFNTLPPNYTESKKTKPTESMWGEYLRVNHTSFSGDINKYPYEPALPNIVALGGEFYYYETDIGTTGTDCDPKYQPSIYNDGTKITRGAARIVYARYDKNRNNIIEADEKHVFYTYNHYNDFQEYLNYYNGWGIMFGNISGGGLLSSKTNYNPTPYVQVYCLNIREKD